MRNVDITITRIYNKNEEKMKKAIDILIKAAINGLIETGEIKEGVDYGQAYERS
ncbi:hypothetical protein SAMN05661008_01497 [Alkalithermobacter thermoalcaliphilus JW-YL-7 = DSM 7308]|uniref:Uncharacterized protein n=1 Tax=Alkalithermobacter thermoalcaliphilus JW-YL-7 = DSM 7308 TaxID=1121328 RepID=A0A150FR10_CLOPD|nr:hypothetical protein JWYL7_1118 [[Clostridium] paradoxum JW-YL-7 = DSM 7308]SHL12569.1 hypothetical protein SAMN05661008_01497 [[Clostridium] paradoxum JW-YL-7 = DSM 7308]